MKSLLLTAAVSALALSANAQISVIPEAGVSLANYRYNISAPAGSGIGDKSGSTATNAGFRGGVNVGFGIGNNLSIQPGLFFTMKGGNEEIGGVKNDTRFNYLELPVNAVYYFGDDQSGFFLSAGGYGAMLLSAKAELSGGGQSATVDYKIGGDEAKDDLRRWDIGVQGGVGYQLRNGLMVRAQYHAGLMNIQHHNQSDNSIRNGMLTIGLGYKFGF